MRPCTRGCEQPYLRKGRESVTSALMYQVGWTMITAWRLFRSLGRTGDAPGLTVIPARSLPPLPGMLTADP